MRATAQKSMQIQEKIRHDAAIMNQSLTDLAKWEKSIRKRDKKIRKASVRATSGGKAPPRVRSGGTISIKTTSTGTAAAPPKPKKKKVKKVTKKKKAVEGGFLNKGTTAAKHTHDKGYDKWAKFDVDAALNEMDEEEEEEVEESESESDDEGPAMHPFLQKSPATALKGLRRPKRSAGIVSAGKAAPSKSREEVEREDGNAHYKKGHFGEAVKCYTRCIAINPRNVMALSNRAMAYLKMKEFKKAVQDCDLALRVDGSHVKSYTRRATAFNGLGMHQAALDNFLTAQSLQEAKQTITDIRKTREMVKSSIRRTPRTKVPIRVLAPGESARVQMQGPVGPGMVAAAEQAYSANAKAQAREREEKEKKERAKAEADAKAKAKAKGAKPTQNGTKHKPGDDEEGGEEGDKLAIKTAELRQSATSAEPPPGSPPVRPNLTPADLYEPVLTEVSQNGAGDGAGEGGGEGDDFEFEDDIDVEDEDHIVIEKMAAASVSSTSTTASSAQQPAQNGVARAAAAEATAESPKKKSPKKKKAKSKSKAGGASGSGSKSKPKTSYEFMAAWRELDSSGRFEYLRAISPSTIKKVFKSNLDSEQLVGIVGVVLEHYFPAEAEAAYRLLKALSGVSRFDMVCMFLSDGEKKDVATIFDKLEAAGVSGDLAALRQSYKLA